jgi:hypothetical protein
MVDQVLFNSAVPCQEIRHEQLGKFWLGTKGGNHRFFGYSGNHTFFHRRRGRDAQWMAIEAPLAEKLAWNLPSLRDFVHRENANPSKAYSHAGACQRD